MWIIKGNPLFMTLNISINMKTRLYFILVIFLAPLFPHQTLMAQCNSIRLVVLGDEGTENTVCAGTDLTIVVDYFPDNCEPASGLEYAWSVPNAPDQPTLQIVNIQGANRSYSVTITDSEDMELAIASIDLTIVGPINVEIQEDDSGTFCEDVDIRLETNVTGGTGDITYSWSNNTDQPRNTSIGRLNEPNPGTDSYTVMVEDSEGCTDTDSKTIVVEPKPSISIPAGGTTWCAGETIELTASGGGGGGSCRWKFPDGVTVQENCTLTIVNADPGDSGDYTLEVTNSDDCTAEQVFSIDVLEVDPTLSPTTTTVCEDDNNLALNPNPPGGTYRVNGNPSGNLISQNNFRSSVAPPGEYLIEYEVMFGDCFGVTSTTITVKPVPEVTFGPNPLATVCAGDDPINLNAFASPMGGQFFSGNTPIVNGQFNPADFSPGPRSVEYRYEEDGCSNSVFSSINISAGPTVSTDPGRNICLGTEIQLDADGQGGSGNYTYQWSPSTNLENTGTKSPTVRSTLPSTTTFTVTVKDTEGCIGTGTQVVTVYPQPTVIIEQTPEFICQGQEDVTLTAKVFGGFGNPTYTWNGPGQAVGGNMFDLNKVNDNLLVSVEVSFNNNAGCQTVSTEKTIIPGSTPDPRIAVNDMSICSNELSYFFVENRREGSLFNWTWDPNFVEEVIPVRDGLAVKVRWKSGVQGSAWLEVEELLGGICVEKDRIVVNVSGGTAPDPAEIFLSPINNTLIYNDSNVDCYRWGYLGDSIIYPEGEIYQSYVTGQGYDPDRLYFCQVWNGDCNDPDGSCSTTIVYRSNEVDENPPQEQEEEEFVLFPNPNSGAFTVQANKLLSNTEYEIRIVNALGQLIKREAVVTAEDKLRTDITLPNAGAGVHYMILYHKGDMQEVRPFVVHAK